MFSKLKKKIKTKLILKNNPFFSSRFGLAGTQFLAGNNATFDCGFDCFGEGNQIKLGNNVQLRNCYFFISGNNNRIVFDDNCYICGTTFWIEDSNNEIVLGRHCTVTDSNNFTCMEGSKIILGDDCMFAENVAIQAGDGHAIYGADGQRKNPSKNIGIGNHVWIGKKASVLKGAVIGDNSVVGMGAIVTKPFEQNNVVLAGIPAKIVETDINWGRNRNG